ncbi:MAG: hypothetical protein QGD92_08090 [Gammaproteobacteria bacterium]|nr:hypothetical protein [Gammaproteobacteria bacterium]
MNRLTKTNTYARPRLLNWMTTGLLTGWVLILAVVVEVNGVAQEINTEKTFHAIEAVKLEADEQ